MWFGNLIAGFVVFGLGAAVIFFASELPYSTEFGPGPGFLPLWLGIGLVSCSLGVLVKTFLKADRARVFFKERTKLGIQMLVLIFITFLLFPLLGFSIGLALFTTISMKALGKHRLIPCGLTGVITAIGIHFLFGRWLDIPLPTGLIGW
jgi:putative tricarboxylic transport membrane protein